MIENFSNKKQIQSLGIDERKSELIEFIIKNENLDQFEENEHFFYWFNRDEIAIGKLYNFLNLKFQQKYISNYKGKDYNLNSFDGIAQLVVDVKCFNEVKKFLGTDLDSFIKLEYFLRYSKKYKRLEYFFYHHKLQQTKHRKNVVVRHKKFKFFSINEKNYVLYYRSNNCPRYISNKNALFLRPQVSLNYQRRHFNISFEKNEKYLKKLNIMLLSIHQKNNLFNEMNFYDLIVNLDTVPNKIMLNASSLQEVLARVTNNRPVPKILTSKFCTSELILLYKMIEYEQVDKIIKFIYENIEVYKNHLKSVQSENRIHSNLNTEGTVSSFGSSEHSIMVILKDYMCVKLNLKKKSPLKNVLEWEDSRNYHYLEDYFRFMRQEGKKINLNIKSIRRLIEEHDNYVRSLDLKSISDFKVNRKFPDVKSDNNFEIEKIITKDRLVSESDIQKHCVKTYSNLINSGACCIYSFLDKRTNLRWTMEVRKINNNKKTYFYVNQLKGKFNSNPEKYLEKEILILVSKYKISTKSTLDSLVRRYNCSDDTFPEPEIINEINNFEQNLIPNNINDGRLPF